VNAGLGEAATHIMNSAGFTIRGARAARAVYRLLVPCPKRGLFCLGGGCVACWMETKVYDSVFVRQCSGLADQVDPSDGRAHPVLRELAEKRKGSAPQPRTVGYRTKGNQENRA